MDKWLIIADDFTGALDTGVHFASAGFETKIYTGCSDEVTAKLRASPCDVAVVNAETRHVTREEAYRTLCRILNAASPSARDHVYIKTDSALRGNIGAEFDAAMDTLKVKRMAFIPAMPQMNRTTLNGRQYINGIPVEKSEFSKDPYEPMRCSYIPQLLQKQTKRPITLVSVGAPMPETDGIHVYDATQTEHIRAITAKLREAGQTRLISGCAGLASVLAQSETAEAPLHPVNDLPSKLLVLCGSINDISIQQCNYAQQIGAARLHLDFSDDQDIRGIVDAILNQYRDRRIVIVDSLGSGVVPGDAIRDEAARQRIPYAFGRLLRGLLDQRCERTVMIVGGDSLLGMIQALSVTSVQPYRELFTGTVLSTIRYQGRQIPLITKSGGFGDPTLFSKVQNELEKGKVRNDDAI